MRTPLLITSLLALAPTTGCGSDLTLSSKSRFEITALPLTLGSIGGATYELAVYNADEALVWSRTNLTSAQYGDGKGALTFVGPCDASKPEHTIALTLVSLQDEDGVDIPNASWRNPAPSGDPVVATATCAPNADTPVSFNLTIMRDAEQGFFDIAVNFEDIFCSAKVDCQSALLHDGETRGPTVVVGFACTAGTSTEGAEPTWLHMTDLTLTCEGQAPLVFDPSGQVGQHGPLGALPTLFETAVYRGHEDLPDVDKCYWNSALGVRVGNAPSCRLTGQATASHAPFGTSGLSPANTVYPYVALDVLVTDAGGNLICGNNALNASGSGVTTAYTPQAGAAFTHEWECDPNTSPIDKRLHCSGELSGTTVAALPTPNGLTVTIGGVRSAPYPLPAGAFVGNGAACCVNPCCDTSL